MCCKFTPRAADSLAMISVFNFLIPQLIFVVRFLRNSSNVRQTENALRVRTSFGEAQRQTPEEARSAHTPCERAFMTIISGFRSVLLSLCCCSRWSIQSISSSCGKKNNTSTRTIARAVVCVVDSQRQRHQRCSYTTLNNDNDDDDATHIK